MGHTTSAPVSRAPKGTFECSWCLLDIQDESAVIIDGDQLCVQCTRESVIPKFHAALKHEIDYPVKWGPLTLKPQDFEEFFNDYLRFIWNWAEKEREYKTPGKDRVYCQEKGCEAYVGDRSAFLFPVALCPGHEKWVCSRCGHPDGEHECKTGQEDDLGDVEGCKRCPRVCVVTLEDGCNLVECECGVLFCYCCGKEDPEYDHFARGKPCPKFGAPGAANALYAEDVFVFGGEEGEIDEEQERHRELFRWAMRIQEELLVLRIRRPDGVMVDIMPDPFEPGAMLDAHQNVLQAIAGHPSIVNLQTEIMNDHRQIMQSLAGRGQDIQRHMEEDGLIQGRPKFGESLEDAAAKLAINVDLYVHYDRIRAAHTEYSARHADIVIFFQQEVPDTLFRFWPRLHAAFAVYNHLAADRLVAAAPEE